MRISGVEDRLAVLGRHSFLAKLPTEVQGAIVEFAHDRRYADGAAIFRRGEPGDSMMAVMSGLVRVCVYSPEGKEVTFCILEEGAVLGEIALLDGKERSADAVSLGESHLLVIERRDFLPYVSNSPEIAKLLIAILCERVRQASDLCENIAFLDVPMRLARTFLKLADSHGSPLNDGRIRIDLKLSQRELGALIATSRESVNKQLRAWQRDGLIEIENGHVILTGLSEFELLASL